jgi:leucyl aminopeptidase
MKKIQVHAQVGRAENEAAEVLVLLHCEGGSDLAQEAAAIDAQLGGQLAALIQRGEFEGKLGEGLLVHTQGKAKAKRLLLAGLGKEKDLRVDAFRQALGCCGQTCPSGQSDLIRRGVAGRSCWRRFPSRMWRKPWRRAPFSVTINSPPIAAPMAASRSTSNG